MAGHVLEVLQLHVPWVLGDDAEDLFCFTFRSLTHGQSYVEPHGCAAGCDGGFVGARSYTNARLVARVSVVSSQEKAMAQENAVLGLVSSHIGMVYHSYGLS